VAGGLIDIEFIAQYLQLVHAARVPDILDTSTTQVLDKAWRLGMLATEDAEVLRPAVRLYHGLTQILRLSPSGPFDPKTAAAGLACSGVGPACPISRRWMCFLPRHRPRYAGLLSASSALRRDRARYFSSNSTTFTVVAPMFLIARVTPGSCQKNSPVRKPQPRSTAPGTLSLISPPSTTMRMPGARCVIAAAD